MTSRFERALIKVIAPDPTKKLALNARLKLIEHRMGTVVWFTPQEIEAIEADRHEAKKECLLAAIGVPLMFGLAAWYADFRPTWVGTLAVLSLIALAAWARTWWQVNDELKTMRKYQTQAHRSFFEKPE